MLYRQELNLYLFTHITISFQGGIEHLSIVTFILPFNSNNITITVYTFSFVILMYQYSEAQFVMASATDMQG